MRQIASILLTLVPAGYVWWSGRRLLRRIDDPAFPELRFADAQRLALVIAASVVAVLAVNGRFLALKLALLLLALVVAGFPARRAIFEESWSLPAYMAHNLRLWSSALGLWVLLALQPNLVRWSGEAALAAAIGLLVATLLYSHFNDRILPFLLRATKLESSELAASFQVVLSKARCPSPRLLRVDAPGGRWVNAYALPSRKAPAVLFTADLLEALTPAEAQAIFAHEVAHLEYFRPGRMLQRELAVALLAAAPLLVVLLYGANSAALAGMTWIWPLVVLLFLAALLAHNQVREHDGDLRALQLAGEPEPLISGLTKIHDLMKMPRRWRAGSEARMSHPSLAKRLRAIRDAAAADGLALDESEPLGDVVVRAAGDPSEAVILTSDRLHWLRGVDPAANLDAATLLQSAGDYRSIRYADLRDLRLAVRGTKQRHLVVVDSRGESLKLSIAPEDVDRVKRAVQHVDLKVEGTALEGSKRFALQTTRQRNARILGILACLLALLPPFSLPLLVAGVLVLARPSTVTLAAAGAIGLGAGLLGGRGAGAFYFGSAPPTALLAAGTLLGLLLLYAAFRSGRGTQNEPAAAARLTLLALGALALLYAIAGLGRLASALPIMQLHLWARYQPAFTLLLLGLAAALWCVRPRLARLPALFALALAALLVAAGTTSFRDRFGDDGLVGSERALHAPASTPLKLRERSIAGSVADLRLAPSGDRFAARAYDWRSGDYRYQEPAFQVELADGGLSEVAAIDLAFLDRDRIAVLRASQSGTLMLQVLGLDPSSAVEFEIALPDLDQPKLRVDPEGQRWEVAEAYPYEGYGVLLSGDFRSGEYRETRWEELRGSPDSYISAVTLNASRHPLVVSQRYEEQRFAAIAMMLAPLSTTALPLWCVEPAAWQFEYVCASNDPGSRTHLWSIDALSQRISPIGSLPAPYYQGQFSQRGQLLVGGYGAAPVLIDLASGTARTLDLEPPAPSAAEDEVTAEPGPYGWLAQLLFGPPGFGPAYEAMALRDGVLAVAFASAEGSTVAVYRLEERDPEP
jgi:Zn-dependent protease with chaperone function